MTGPAALLASLAGASAMDARVSVLPTRREIVVPVTASNSVGRRISDRLTLRLNRETYTSGAVAGWEVAVEDNRRPNQGNLLHQSPFWHGPHPSQVSAWIVRDHFYPSSNTLDVHGHPWRVRIECLDCVTAGKGPDAYFISGTVRVRWSRR